MSVPYDSNVLHDRNLKQGVKTLQEYLIVLHRIDITDYSEMVYNGKAERKRDRKKKKKGGKKDVGHNLRISFVYLLKCHDFTASLCGVCGCGESR